jgi:hypothetical protein
MDLNVLNADLYETFWRLTQYCELEPTRPLVAFEACAVITKISNDKILVELTYSRSVRHSLSSFSCVQDARHVGEL